MSCIISSNDSIQGRLSSIHNDCPAEKVEQLNEQLEQYEAVSICLKHLYLKHQIVPGYLKDHDPTLYVLLSTWRTVEEETYENGDGDDEGRVGLTVCDLNQKCSDLKVKFVVNHLREQSRVQHTPSEGYTGNEAQAVYLVMGRAKSNQQSKRRKLSHA